MTTFHTMAEFQYLPDEKILLHKESGIRYQKYVGVSKVSKLGEQKLVTKLTNRFGAEKARRIQQKSIERGNRIHKNPLDVNQTVVPPEWKSVGRDIFLFSRLLPDCPPVQGSLDELFVDDQGRHYIVEYKTKSNKASWARYKHECLPDYFRQTSAYAVLFEKYYGIRPAGVLMVILFPDTHETPEICWVRSEIIQTHFAHFIRNLSHFNVD